MSSSKLTLRHVQETSAAEARQRFTWHRGSIQPFASLWITVLRFALLNRPKFASLNEDLQGSKAARLRHVIKFGSKLPWPQHENIDITSFARMLGEPLEAFRWSSTGDFPLGIQALFDKSAKICPSCMAQGFHTVIFSAGCIQRCPYHGDTLLDRCPDCRGDLDDRSKANPGIVPRICRCEREWLSLRLARTPPSDAARDAAMSEVVAWALKVGSRCWAYVPRRPHVHHALQWDTLHDHIERWRVELEEKTPEWLSLSLSPQAQHHDLALARCIEQSGMRRSSLARVRGAGRAHLTPRSLALPRERSQEPLLHFKCIRRYLVNHVLGNRVGLLVWMGENQSAPKLRKCLQENRFAHVAWALLYWMQSSHWGVTGARTWFQKLHGVSTIPRYDNDPARHWGGSIQDHVLVYPGNELEEWIVNWVNASTLLDIWPTQKDLEAFSTDAGFIQATHTRTRRLPVRWWAWLGDDGFLKFGVYRRRPECWIPVARRCSKEERRQAFVNNEIRRLQVLRDAMGAQTLRRLEDGTWTVDGRRVFAPCADLRSARLLIGTGITTRFGVGIDPLPSADPAAPWFVRSLDHPVCVVAGDIKSGVLKLKLAVRAYLKVYPGTSPLSAPR